MTLQELDVIYSNAYEKAYYFGEPPHFKALPLDDYIALSEWASLRAMAAVVRALRDEVDAIWTTEDMGCGTILDVFNQILDSDADHPAKLDQLTREAYAAGKPAPATDPAPVDVAKMQRTLLRKWRKAKEAQR